jgi:hypothetical protein
MRSRILAFPLLALTLLALAPGRADAQIDLLPRLTITGGYQYMLDKSWEEKLDKGWVAAVAYKIGEITSVVAEGSGSYGKLTGTNWTIERYAFLGGIKFQVGGEGPRPFVQFMAGLSRQAGDVGIVNGLALQPGGGVDLPFGERLSLRVFGDYRLIREKDRSLATGPVWVRYNQYRVGGAVVWVLIR